MNSKLKAAFFSYLEAGIASVIILAYTAGPKHPLDFLWAFLAGFAGPVVKALNPLDASFGIKPIVLPVEPSVTPEQKVAADTIAKAVTGAVEPVLDPVINKVAQLAAPIVQDIIPPQQ